MTSLASFSFSNFKKPEYMLSNILTFAEKEFKKPSFFRNHLKFSNWAQSDRAWSILALLMMSQEKSRGQLKWLQNFRTSLNWHILIKIYFIALSNNGFRHFGGVAESFTSKIPYQSRNFSSNLQSAIRNLTLSQLFRNKTSWIVLELTKFWVVTTFTVAPLCKQCVWV